MKKYIRNPRKKEMTNADGELQEQRGNEEKKFKYTKKGVAEAKKMAKQTGGKIKVNKSYA